MNRLIILVLILQSSFANAQNCSALFSYGAYFDKVEFYNQSNVSNAHYYWNFGDGCSSAFKNPVHTFPGYGKYYVTLYVHDSINGCSAYSDLWINVTKAASNLPPCLPLMTDSFWVSNPNYYVLKDHSTNCSGLIKSCLIAGNGGGWCLDQADLGNWPFFAPSWISYASNALNTEELYAKTTIHNFSPSKNYQGCSANFEFSIIYANDTAQKILFKAMSTALNSYTWVFTGFGAPIYAYGDTASIYYGTNASPGVPYYTKSPVSLYVSGNGCKDSMYQVVSIRHTSVTTVGLTENPLEKAEINLFPNPATTKLNLQIRNGNIVADRAVIQNLLGQRIKEFIRPDLTELDITDLSPGAYFLTLGVGSYTKAFKFIKE